MLALALAVVAVGGSASASASASGSGSGSGSGQKTKPGGHGLPSRALWMRAMFCSPSDCIFDSLVHRLL